MNGCLAPEATGCGDNKNTSAREAMKPPRDRYKIVDPGIQVVRLVLGTLLLDNRT